jgi:hypothetical protein
VKISILIICLSVLLLSGCSVKNDTKNDLYENQMCYYQDNNLTIDERNINLDKSHMLCLEKQNTNISNSISNLLIHSTGTELSIFLLFPELILLFF